MPSEDYVAKSAYHGDVAARYEEQRKGEAVWNQEQAFVEAWIRDLEAGSVILDLPAGTGRFFPFFKARGLRVHARDISEDMLAEIRRAYPWSLTEGWDVRAGDAEHLDLPNDAVDYVLSWRFFHLIPPAVIDRVLREFARVCRGTIVIQVFAVRSSGMRMAAWQRVKGWLRPLWRRLRRASTATECPWGHIASFSHPENDLRAAFARAGLEERRAVTLSDYQGLPTRVYFLERRARIAPV